MPPTPSTPGKETVTYDPRQPRDKFFAELMAKLRHTDHFFAYNDRVWTDCGGKFSQVESATLMGGFVGEAVNIMKLDQKGNPTYISLPTADATYIMGSHQQRSRLHQVQHYTEVPTLDPSGAAALPGSNPSDGTYYEGPKILPAAGTHHLNQLLKAIHFKRATDRTNFLSFMLTPLLGPAFPGGRPIAMIKGNQPSVGKTTAATVIAVLASNDGDLASVTYERNDGELEKKIAACIRRGSNTVLIDNIHCPGNAVVTSASLERTVTAKNYNFRRVGTSQMITGVNHIQFLGTFNGGTLSTDWSSRSVFVLMHYAGDTPRMPEPVTGPIVDYASKNRTRLLAELLGMLDRWAKAGRPTKSTPCRFAEWAKTLNGILSVNGHHDFLASYSEDRGEADEVQMALEQLAAERPGVHLPASEWRREAEKLKLLVSKLNGHSDRSKDTKMGNVLKWSVGRRVRRLAEDGEPVALYRLTAEAERNGTTYGFVEEQPAGAEPMGG